MRKLLILALVVIANFTVVAQTDYEKLYKDGTIFLKEKNYQKAIETFATIINSKPDNQRLMKYAYI